jgi:hypothetical protein
MTGVWEVVAHGLQQHAISILLVIGTIVLLMYNPLSAFKKYRGNSKSEDNPALAMVALATHLQEWFEKTASKMSEPTLQATMYPSKITRLDTVFTNGYWTMEYNLDACPTSGSAMAYTTSPMLEDLMETSASCNKVMKDVSFNGIRHAFGLSKDEEQKVVASLRDLEQHTDGVWISMLTGNAAALDGIRASAGFRPTAVVCFVMRTGALVHKLVIIDVHDQAYKAYNALLMAALTVIRAQLRAQLQSHPDTFFQHELDTAALLQAFKAKGLVTEQASKAADGAADGSAPQQKEAS